MHARRRRHCSDLKGGHGGKEVVHEWVCAAPGPVHIYNLGCGAVAASRAWPTVAQRFRRSKASSLPPSPPTSTTQDHPHPLPWLTPHPPHRTVPSDRQTPSSREMMLMMKTLLAGLALATARDHDADVVYRQGELALRDPASYPHEVVLSARPHTYLPAEALPAAWDWRAVDGKSYTTGIQNQHEPFYCGGCWAFSAMSSLADRIHIAALGQYPHVMPSVSPPPPPPLLPPTHPPTHPPI